MVVEVAAGGRPEAVVIPFPVPLRRWRTKFNDTEAELTDFARQRHLWQCLRGIRLATDLHAEGLICGMEMLDWIKRLREDAEEQERTLAQGANHDL